MKGLHLYEDIFAKLLPHQDKYYLFSMFSIVLWSIEVRFAILNLHISTDFLVEKTDLKGK